jgi:hypothetical protein
LCDLTVGLTFLNIHYSPSYYKEPIQLTPWEKHMLIYVSCGLFYLYHMKSVIVFESNILNLIRMQYCRFSSNFIVARIFVTTVTFLPSHCLAMIFFFFAWKLNLFASYNSTFSECWKGLRISCRRVLSSTPLWVWGSETVWDSKERKLTNKNYEYYKLLESSKKVVGPVSMQTLVEWRLGEWYTEYAIPAA